MQILQGNAHAYVVVGKRNEAVERILSEIESEIGGKPKNHVDVFFLETPQFGIEDALRFKHWHTTAPGVHTRKFAVLSAFSFTREAQNALLKTLEEPMGATRIIIATESSRALLPTILSRCVIITSTNTRESKFPKELVEVLTLSQGERLAHPYIVELVTKKDEDGKTDRQAIVETLSYLELALQVYLEKSDFSSDALSVFQKAGTILLKNQSYSRDTGASLKMLLEHSLLSMPVFKSAHLNLENEMIH